MSLEKLEALEVRVRKLVELLVELRQEKTQLEEQLQMARERLIQQEKLSHEWEAERTHLRSRLEKVLDELEFLDNAHESPGGVT